MIDHLRHWLKQEGYEMTLKSGSLASCTTRVILLANETALGGGHAVVAENKKIIYDPLGDPTLSATFPYSQQIEIVRKQET
jgi:hypothetical protein